MGQIALSIPQDGVTFQTEGPKVENDLTIIQNVINGNLDEGNISPSAKLVGYEWVYVQRTTLITVASSNSAAPTTVLTLPSFTADGSPVMVEFWCYFLQPLANQGITVALYESGSQITPLADLLNGTSSGAAGLQGRYRFTPSAAAHTYTIGGYTTSGSVSLLAPPPLFARITKV